MKRILSVLSCLFAFMMAITCNSGLAKASADVWQNAGGFYSLEGSGQFNNGMLKIWNVDESFVIFEFNMMQGSEREKKSRSYAFSGMLTKKGDKAVYEGGDNNPVRLELACRDKVITVKQKGVLPIEVDGAYNFEGKEMDLSEASGIVLIEHLSPALTSLNVHNQGYALRMFPEMTPEGYYFFLATREGKEIAAFLMSRSMTSVWRVDAEPIVQVFGVKGAEPPSTIPRWEEAKG